MRGRRPDAVDQDAKGNPGKRRRKPTIADRVKLLSEAPATSSSPLAPPVMFGLEEFEGAIRIWHEFAPQLERGNVLHRLDRHTLAMFCYYLDRFWSAVAQLAQDGTTQRVKTVAGGYMLRDHPAIRHRDDAAKIVFDLSQKFGFSPLDRNKLMREIAGTGQPVGGLFGEGGGEERPAQPDAPAPDDDDPDGITGFAARNRAVPPSRMN